LKYTISYRTEFGTISAESKKPQDLVEAYGELKNIERNILSPKKRQSQAKKTKSKERPEPKSLLRGRGGRGETATVIREIESSLLTSSFFSTVRTTGEVREKLREVSRKPFTSRKVSQALGILWKKGLLKRSGTRNFFTYSTV
jgi:hypothetical protein